MRLDALWSDAKPPTVSFELFPARSEKAAQKLAKTVEELAGARPDFVSVTFGAGGSTREGSLALARALKDGQGLEVLAYFNGWGMGPPEVEAILASYRDLGVQNVLLVRGDPPADGEGPAPHPESFAHASDLLGFVAPRFDFCLGAAGYPEGHKEAPSLAADIGYLKLKQERGARFVIANYFYDNELFFRFRALAVEAGVTIPIVPGIMPMSSAKMTENLAALCGAAITPELRAGMDAVPAGDKDALEAFGVEFALGQCRGLLRRGVPGLHIYTMDRSAGPVRIVETLRAEGLLPG
ncbi:MAG TPA: methylenetetrahydrofolate reductase [Polyangia bacterium]|nr:methylenetetrahydrofolate reductase [Polyangia bacterium]